VSFLTATQSELIYSNTSVATAKNTFTAEALINDTAGMGPQPVLPPYFWQPSGSVAKAIKVIARGIISSTGTPTFQVICRLGGAASIAGPSIGTATALATASGITNRAWELEMDAQLTVAGAPGGNSTVRGLGLFTIAGSASVSDVFGGGASPGTVATVDISILNYINISAVCSASSASNSITLLQLLVFGLN
jgi:hypothetical protein